MRRIQKTKLKERLYIRPLSYFSLLFKSEFQKHTERTAFPPLEILKELMLRGFKERILVLWTQFPYRLPITVALAQDLNASQRKEPTICVYIQYVCVCCVRAPARVFSTQRMWAYP